MACCFFPSSSNICNSKAHPKLPPKIHSPPHALRCLRPGHLIGHPTATIYTQVLGNLTGDLPLNPFLCINSI